MGIFLASHDTIPDNDIVLHLLKKKNQNFNQKSPPKEETPAAVRMETDALSAA